MGSLKSGYYLAGGITLAKASEYNIHLTDTQVLKQQLVPAPYLIEPMFPQATLVTNG